MLISNLSTSLDSCKREEGRIYAIRLMVWSLSRIAMANEQILSRSKREYRQTHSTGQWTDLIRTTGYIADMPGLGREASEVKCYQLKDDDEHLRGIVPESHDLFQVLHHAYTYRTDRWYYAVSSHVALLYLIQINFRNWLLHAYQSFTDENLSFNYLSYLTRLT